MILKKQCIKVTNMVVVKSLYKVHRYKISYYGEQIIVSLNDGEKMCGLVRDLAPKTSSHLLTRLESDGKTISNLQNISESFKDLFANIDQVITETYHQINILLMRHEKVVEFL